MIGSADAMVSDFGAGETRTIEFISLDDYTDWDSVEFKVDFQF